MAFICTMTSSGKNGTRWSARTWASDVARVSAGNTFVRTRIRSGGYARHWAAYIVLAIVPGWFVAHDRR